MKKNLKMAACGAVMAAAAFAAMGCGHSEKVATSAIVSETEAADETTASVVEITETSAAEESDSAADEAAENAEDEYFVKEPVLKYGTVESVDADNYSITIDTVYEKTGKKDSSAADSESVIFNATEYVPIIDAATGEAIELKDVQKGSSVYAWAGDTMTLSLPAQMSLQALVTNIPADASAPMYVVVKGFEWSKDDSTLTIKTTDGQKWYASAKSTEVKPFRTKQIVKLDDIRSGSRLIIWGSDSKDAGDGELAKVMILSSAE